MDRLTGSVIAPDRKCDCVRQQHKYKPSSFLKRVLGLARPVFVKVDRAHLKCGHMRQWHNTNLPRSKSDDGLYKSRSDSPEILSRETRQAGRVENVNESSRFDLNRIEVLVVNPSFRKSICETLRKTPKIFTECVSRAVCKAFVQEKCIKRITYSFNFKHRSLLQKVHDAHVYYSLF